MVTLQDGLNFHRAGRMTEAEAVYRAALSVQPQNVHVLHLLGVLRAQCGDNAEAVALIGEALEIDPSAPAFHIHMGHALAGLGRRTEALASYDRAVALEPNSPAGHLPRGEVLWKLRRIEEAAAAFEDTIALDPRCAQAWASLGGVLFELKRLEEALTACDSAIAIDPKLAQAHTNRSTVLHARGRANEAVVSASQAIALNPLDATSVFNRGNAYSLLGRIDEAVADYDRALALQPDYADALMGRGAALLIAGRYEEACTSSEKALALDPTLSYAACNAYFASAQLCDWRDRDQRIKDLEWRSREHQIKAPYQLLGAYDDPELQLLASKRNAEKAKQPRPNGPATGHKRLRIAYLSPDFHDHPVGHQAVQLFERHDRTQFETYGVCLLSSTESEFRGRMRRAFDHFVEAGTRSDRDIAQLLGELQIDIAVDLAGYTYKGRTNVLSFRAVPVAVNYLGYPGTLGADFIDYIIADGRVIPEEAECFYSEKIARVPDCFLPCETMPAIDRPPSRSDAGLPEAGFVFCAFNSSFKITPEMYDIWMRLLRNVDGSILWMSVGNRQARANLRAEAEKRGVPGHRLIFADRVNERERHIARIGLADLFLDTLPYNAHATASDALQAGVPLVTCMGRSFQARVAGSLLSAIGMEELITTDLGAYEKLALDLAQNPARLATVRARLRRNRAEYPLFDTAKLCRSIECAYTTMWDIYRSGEPPRSFTVSGSAIQSSGKDSR